MRPQVIDELIEELKGVHSILPSAYSDVDDEDDDVFIEAGQIESEEVEVALSAVISVISKQCKLVQEPSSLSGLLELLFSPEDDLVSVAVNLEDAINGYFGELFGEDLDLADDYLTDLIDLLQQRRDKWTQRNG
ncbi:hypothetical protein [Granulicella mallensis]|uniref:Uncharacterized protein n=1 Tax=Granulicella mallensis TaxID=940614 RepID=A0A7W7ZNY6_9BACT|nr:hypothetical protein [Granulicella mallensis]MBB5063118.1 hypothetical protein [Granulicella mallensis]